MGLLDLTPDQSDSLMSLGMGLLSASGPSRMPVSTGQALAAGFEAMKENEAKRQQMSMRDTQLRQMKAQADDQDKVRSFYSDTLPKMMYSGSTQALSNGQGPTLENAQKMPQLSANQLYQAMVQSGSPTLAQAGLSGMTKEDAPITVAEGGALVRKDGTPLFTNYNMKPVNGYQVPDGKGGYAPDMNLFRLEAQLKREGRPVQSVSVNTQKNYAGNVAEGLAKQDLAIIDTARAAPSAIRTSKTILDALDQNPITGTGAGFRLAAQKLFSTAGLIDGDRVKTTEDLASAMASATLDGIKTSGLGAGQGFSNADRDFLEKARAGNLEMNPGTIRRLALLNQTVAAESIKRAQNISNNWKKNPDFGGVASTLEFDNPDLYVNPSQGKQSNRVRTYNPATGRIE